MNIFKRTKGNYLDFITRNFPLDCEGMNLMQSNNALLSILGNIGGNRYILKGCTQETVYEGYVFLATNDAPEGELLYVEPKPASVSVEGALLHVVSTPVDITAQGYSYPAAYTCRSLAWGLGVEQYAFETFMPIKTNAKLHERITALENEDRSPAPIGSIIMFAGSMAPKNYFICDGSEISKADYPDLFAVIGNSYGNPIDANKFKLPDLRSRFPAGYNPADEDFNVIGKKEGSKQALITLGNMPDHSHIQRVSPESGVFPKRPGYRIDTDPGLSPEQATRNEDNIDFVPWKSSNGGSGDGDDFVHTLHAGGGQPLTHIQPYLTLNFIIKVK